jgi:hypothetical protein
MSDSVAATSKQQTAIGEQEYRELCKQVRQYQLKKGIKRKNAPMLNSLGDVEILTPSLKIQKSQTDWDYLKNGMPFVTDIKATLVYVKTGKARAMCLNTMQSVPVGGALVHRVFL